MSTQTLTATINTSRGDIRLELFADDAPVTVANFVNLANRGYYDGLIFHRVIADFMIQGGDPNGNGTGGPGYAFKDECKPNRRHAGPGVLSMANAGPGTNGSQFFITHDAQPHLDGRHTVFGQVTNGQDVVNAMQVDDKMVKVTIDGDCAPLLEAQKSQVDSWNKVLDEQYPRTR